MPGGVQTATVEDQIQSALNAYNAQGLSRDLELLRFIEVGRYLSVFYFGY